MEAIVGDKIHEITVVGTFSERQHEVWPDSFLEMKNIDGWNPLSSQITLRSNAFQLRRTAQGWEPLQTMPEAEPIVPAG